MLSQKNQAKPARVDGGKLVVWAELLQHFRASVTSPGTTELYKFRVQERLHPLPVVARLILMKLGLEASKLLEQAKATSIK